MAYPLMLAVRDDFCSIRQVAVLIYRRWKFSIAGSLPIAINAVPRKEELTLASYQAEAASFAYPG
jgi:hypothetical protein